MGISNVSNGLRSGVCTSSTRPTAPYEGQMIYETDTNRVLVWDNAAWVMIADTDTPPGLELVKTQTFTTTTTANVESCFSSTYDFYKITFQFSSASGNLTFNLLDGSTLRNASSYYTAGFSIAGIVGTLNAKIDNATTSSTITTENINGNAQFVMELRYNPSGQTMWTSIGTAVGNAVTEHRSGGYHTTVSHNGFRLTSTANMSGTIRVYGYRV